MELYTLDSLLRRTAIVDRFDSLIWTERYDTPGDFELVIPSNGSTRTLLSNGQLLAMNESNRVMQVDSIQDANDSEGRALLTVKGPSLEASLDDRVSRPADSALVTKTVNGSSSKVWEFKDTPGNIARAVFKAVCFDGSYSVLDKLPFIAVGTLYPADTIPEWDQAITYDIPLTSSVEKVVEDLVSTYGMGYRLTRNLDNSQLFFNVYSGSDRTTKQTSLAPVIFSPGLDNLLDSTYLSSIAGTKNTAIVIKPDGTTMLVYGNGASETTSGFDRKVMIVDGSGITALDGSALTGQALTDALTQVGQAALAQARSVQAVDGEISQFSNYVYGRDYNLGDLVELRDKDGFTNEMKITEQIFISDSSGERSYPTLSAQLFITPGSWYSSDGAHIWNDAVGDWADA